ncbi:MAG: hypothetical protein AAF713_09155 [Pseudomonadota bacterium]
MSAAAIREGSVAYREEVFHPALKAPAEASGTFRRRGNGTLIRHQREPVEEIAEIGEAFIALRRDPDEIATLVPIPADIAPIFALLRRILSVGSVDGAGLSLSPDPGGWRIDAGPETGGMVLRGCGAVLQGLEIAEPGGVLRRITFRGRE